MAERTIIAVEHEGIDCKVGVVSKAFPDCEIRLPAHCTRHRVGRPAGYLSIRENVLEDTLLMLPLLILIATLMKSSLFLIRSRS